MYKVSAKTVIFAVGMMVAGDMSQPRTGVAQGRRHSQPSMTREEVMSNMRMGQYFMHVVPWVVPWWNYEVRPADTEPEHVEDADNNDSETE